MMVPDDAPEIPKRLTITLPETRTKYTLYIETDNIVCNHCHRPGHIFEKCKKRQDYQQNFPHLSNPTFRTKTSVSSRLIVNTNNEERTSAPKEPLSSERQPTNFSPWGKVPQQEKSHENNFASSSFFSSEDTTSKELTSETENNETENSESRRNESQVRKRSLSVSPDSPISQVKLFRSTGDGQTIEINEITSDDDESLSSKSDVNQGFSKQSKKKALKQEKENEALNTLFSRGFTFDKTDLTAVSFKNFLSQARGHQNSKKVAETLSIPVPPLVEKLGEAIRLLAQETKGPTFNLRRKLERCHDSFRN